jgi:hypothetical protein
MWKLFKQITRCSPLDPPHYFTWRKGGALTKIYTWSLLTTPRIIRISKASQVCLTSSLTRSRYFSSLNFVTVFCSPNKMILDLKNCMTTVSLFHRYASLSFIFAAKAGGLNLDDGKLI